MLNVNCWLVSMIAGIEGVFGSAYQTKARAYSVAVDKMMVWN
jgi:hypothetical protein